VVEAPNGEAALAHLSQGAFDLVLTDLKMPLKDGLEVLTGALKLPHPPLVILATAHGTVEVAVQAMKMGAFNFLLKPFSPEALEAAVEKASDHLRLKKEHRYYREEVRSPLKGALVAKSAAMQQVLANLEKIAKSQASVFLIGESGTGKEVLAAEIHRLSPRGSAPFVKVNCAAVPETLLEAEFFGYEKGAFTGAHARKLGRFELADQGTLLHDEVTEIPLTLQPKLLRAIQEQEIERLGGTKAVGINVRFIATSNRNMQEAIESKVFREDLYYRLNVLPIHLPPLRQRLEDIVPLAEHFIRRFCLENHKPLKTLTPRAAEKLQAYPWPGNVRELANIIERTVVLDFDACIDADHLYLQTLPSVKGGHPPLSLHEVEKRHILETLRAIGDNRTKAAELLGISVRTLRNKLQEYAEGD
jgi:two-component system response regulator AtoC